MSENPKIVEKREMVFVGLELKDAETKNVLFHYMWVWLCPRFNEIKNVVDRDTIYAVWYKPNVKSQWYRLVGVEVSKVSKPPKGMASVRVPAGKYAKIPVIGGSHQIPQGFKKISDWRTGQNYERRFAALERYDTKQPITENYQVELYQGIK